MDNKTIYKELVILVDELKENYKNGGEK